MYSGKQFEQDFMQSFKNADIPYVRLYDTTNGFSGIKNPCDFIVCDGKHMVMLELKVCHTTTFAMSNVTHYQTEELLKWDDQKGVIAGLLICYYNESEPVQSKIYFIRMIVLSQYLQEMKRKSIRVLDAQNIGVPVVKQKSRTRMKLDIPDLMDNLRRVMTW